MSHLRRISPAQPVVALGASIAIAALLDGGGGSFFTSATYRSIVSYVGTLGLVALGLAVVVAVGHFDLSVGVMAGMAGAIAVRLGGDSAVIGVLAGVAFGALFGVAQGVVVTKLGINSVATTLGGLLVLQGLLRVVTGNSTISFDNVELALRLGDPFLVVFNIRSITVLLVVIVTAVFLAVTRLGRDALATGSDERAARIAGVQVDRMVVLAFAFSGTVSALGGILLSYSLASASPVGLTDLLVPAIAAVIIGGVKMTGGRCSPVGVLLGVLTLSALRSGLTAAGQPSRVQALYVGGVLLAVAVLESPGRQRFLAFIRSRLAARSDGSAVGSEVST